jgi:cell division protein ZapA
MPEPRVIQIEVHGQRYPIRTTLDQSYVLELALYVDRKITLAADASPSSDTLGLAVLTALNITDELFRTRDLRVSESDSLSARAVALEEMVDQALQLAGHSGE